MWNTPGGDFIAESSASVSVDANGSYTWMSEGMIEDVQGWLDVPATNAGWIMITDETEVSAKRFDSRENPTETNRPELFVEYFVSAAAAVRLPRAALPVQNVPASTVGVVRVSHAAPAESQSYASEATQNYDSPNRRHDRVGLSMTRRLLRTAKNRAELQSRDSETAFQELVDTVLAKDNWRS